jgi:hypothetical protein
MSYSEALLQFKRFMQSLRGDGSDLGLEPEFSVIEALVLKEGEEKVMFFRENLDRFWESQRGLKVLAKLSDKAAEQQLPLVVQGLEQLRTEINNLFTGQFLYYAPERFTVLPHSAMIRTMSKMANENEPDKVFEYIDQNIEAFEGHFFVILASSMRNARSSGENYTVEFLTMLGSVVARRRLEAKLPCSFAYLYGVALC